MLCLNTRLVNWQVEQVDFFKFKLFCTVPFVFNFILAKSPIRLFLRFLYEKERLRQAYLIHFICHLNLQKRKYSRLVDRTDSLFIQRWRRFHKVARLLFFNQVKYVALIVIPDGYVVVLIWSAYPYVLSLRFIMIIRIAIVPLTYLLYSSSPKTQIEHCSLIVVLVIYIKILFSVS